MGQSQQRIVKFLHYQRYLGLTDLEYSKSLRGYQNNGSWFSMTTQLLVQLTFLSAFLATFRESLSYVETKSRTGDIYDHVVILAAPATQFLANIWFRCHQNTQLILIEKLGQHSGLLQVDTLALNYPQWFFRLWLGVCGYYAFNVVSFAITTWLKELDIAHILSLIGFTLRMLYSNYITTCYVSLVHVLKQLFQAQANQLSDLLTENSKVICLNKMAKNLRTHDELVLLGQRELAQVYGGALLFPILYLVLDATSILYISTIQWRHSHSNTLVMTGWFAPLVLYLCLPLVINDLATQYAVIGVMEKVEMSELYVFYRICRYLGIFCIHYNVRKERYRLRRSLFCYLVHFGLQTYLVTCMTILVLYWKRCFKSENTATGNHYDRLVMFLALGMQFIQNAWLICLQGPHLRIVRQLELYRRKYLIHMRLLLPKRMLWIIMVVNLLYLMNFIKCCVLEWFANASRLFVFSTLGFPVRCLITSFTMGTYLGLINILLHILHWIQSQLIVLVDQLKHPKRSSDSILRLRSCLDLYDRVVLLCNDEISLVYGFIAWLSVLFASLDVTGIIYLTMVIQTDKTLCEHLLFNIIWLSPTLMTCVAVLMSNRVAIQCLGLLCITHDGRTHCTNESDNDNIVALVGLVLAQCCSGLGLVYLVSSSQQFQIPSYNHVGNTHMLVNCGFAWITISVLYIYFYLRRRRFLLFISLMLYHHREDLGNCHNAQFLRKYFVYAGLCMITFIMYYKAYSHSDIKPLPCVLLTVTFTISFVLFGLVIVLYNCQVEVLSSLLRLYNDDLVKSATSAIASTSVWRLRLEQRNRLIWACHEHLNSEFGLVMVIIMAYVLFSAPAAPFFLITMVFEMDRNVPQAYMWHALGTSVIWNLPWQFSLMMLLRTDVVWKEV